MLIRWSTKQQQNTNNIERPKEGRTQESVAVVAAASAAN